MYSLVSASVLGFDLTRLGGGASTAEVLLRALVLTKDELPTLARYLSDAETRAELWLDVEAAANSLPTLRGVSELEDPMASLKLVERAPIGSLDSLLRCIRYDIMSWTWTGQGTAARQTEQAETATAVLCDAVVSTYLKDVLEATTRRRLAIGWVSAMRRLPAGPPVDLGPHHYAVSALLDRLRALRDDDVRRLVRAADDGRRHPTGWSTAAHSASWAAYLSDRVRTAAAAQLLLVQAIDTAGVPVSDRAGGVWNVLSGAVQALVVRDLLDTATAHRLLAPVVAVLGPAWLS